MSTTSFAFLGPVGTCILGALLCLFLEAAGTPAGARKLGTRFHLVLIAVLVLGAALLQILANWRNLLDSTQMPSLPSSSELLFDGPSRFSMVALIILLLQAVLAQVPSSIFRSSAEKKALESQARGEVIAILLLYAALGMVFLSTEHLLTLTVAYTALGLCHIGLAALDDNKTQGAEAVAKEAVLLSLNLILLSLCTALAFTVEVNTLPELIEEALNGSILAKLALIMLFLAVASGLPLAPVHALRMDVISGAPAFAGGLISASGLIFGGSLLLRAVHEFGGISFASADAEQFIAIASIVVIAVPSVAALDQQRIFRAVLYLVLGMVGMLLPVVAMTGGNLAAQEQRIALLIGHGALVSFGALIAVAIFEKPNLGSTWEDWSGLGRRAPLAASLLLVLLASVIGLPGTFGFSLRLDVAQAAFSENHVWIGGVVLLTPVVGLAAVARLTLFLFSKTPRKSAFIDVNRLRILILFFSASVAIFGGLGYVHIKNFVGWLLLG